MPLVIYKGKEAWIGVNRGACISPAAWGIQQNSEITIDLFFSYCPTHPTPILVRLPLTSIFLSAFTWLNWACCSWKKEEVGVNLCGLKTMNSLETLASYTQQKSHDIISTLENPFCKRHIMPWFLLGPQSECPRPSSLPICSHLVSYLSTSSGTSGLLITISNNLCCLQLQFLPIYWLPCLRLQMYSIKKNLFLDLSKCDLTPSLFTAQLLKRIVPNPVDKESHLYCNKQQMLPSIKPSATVALRGIQDWEKQETFCIGYWP